MRRLLLIGLVLALVAGCGKFRKNRSGDGEATASGGGGGGAATTGGAVQNVRGAVQRTVTLHDMDQIRLFIDTASLDSGQMPTAQQTAAALQKAAPKIFALVQEGVIVLTGARTREGVWAYTQQPQTTGGEHLVLTSSGIERMTAAALQQRLQQGR